ncbi:hypothetical protein FA13DRAFT_1723744 [Coprinellus micaceus]|uniref:Uncharacterized protein n=1 Tax=Coprinellus micaceus TaxID=71717 RepID=A0A4Y7S9M5_COPMI|nr:hypothetical protein FA13DRAFT_1746364 [Coprinellus micaceus]TEB39534.1 hypothetical protein FA13DRAFT_1723744 [Coprinellus micaceus]
MPSSSCIQNIQIGFKNFSGSLSLAFFGTVTLLTSLCSGIYGMFACSHKAAGEQQEHRCSLRLWVSSKPSGNFTSSLPRSSISSPSPALPQGCRLKTLSLPIRSRSSEGRTSPEQKFAMGPGPIIRQIISFANFKKEPSDKEPWIYVDRQPRRGVSFLDMSSATSTYPGPSPHRVSPSTVSSASCQTLVGSASSCVTLTEHVASDMPYREMPVPTDFGPQMHKSGFYPRRPSRTEQDDEHTIHIIPINEVRPTLSSLKSPVHFHNPFSKSRQAPTRQKPRPRRNPKLALTLGEFFSSRTHDSDALTNATNPSLVCADGTPFPPRNSIRFPPRRYSRTSTYIPPRRGSNHALPNRACSPEPALESLPVPPSWRRPRQPHPIDMFSPDDDEMLPAPV